jgi:O-antigen/teichoic acid export membrane protein
VWLAAAALVFSVLSGYNSTLNGVQNAARQRAVVAFHGGIDAWLKILLGLGAMLSLGATSLALVIGYSCSSLLVMVSQLFFLRRIFSQTGAPPGIKNRFVQQMWAYSWPFSAWGIFSWMQQVSDRWALQAFVSTADVGQYAVLFQIGYTPVALVTTMAMTFLGPILYQRAGDAMDCARNTHVHRLGWQMAIISLLVTFFGVIFAFVMHEWIFRLLAAASYRKFSYLLPWLVLAGGLFAAGQILALKLMSEMKSVKMVSAKIFTALLGLSFNIYGASEAGVPGVVSALVAFSLVYLAWMILLASKMPHLKKQ